MLIYACSSGTPEPSAPPNPAKRARPCSLYASPRGSDGPGRGSRHRPFRTLGRLVRSLRRGWTGCLQSGRYVHLRPVRMQRPGVMLRSAPGARAAVDGAVWVEPSAKGVRLSRLYLTARDELYSIPLKILADNVRIDHNTITTVPNSICVLIGSDHPAERTLIEGNRIRNCGKTGKYDHLLYLQGSRDAVIRWNVLSANPGGWAVHLYPDADRTLVEHNVIDGNQGGVVFAGDGAGTTSDLNLVRNNAITFSGPRWNVEGSWSDGPQGVGNAAEHNCVFSIGPNAPGGVAPPNGFTTADNPVVPGSPYLNREGGDYRFLRDNPCIPLVGNVTAHLRR
jgi:hypothetical protein